MRKERVACKPPRFKGLIMDDKISKEGSHSDGPGHRGARGRS